MQFRKIVAQPLIGASLAQYLRLLTANRFRISLRYSLRAIYILLSSTFLVSILGGIEKWLLDKKISATTISTPPIFIIGHWRSGTSYLHSLMVQDSRFGFMTNRQAFMPNLMFVAPTLIRLLVKIHLLPKRPMDDVKLTPDSPQEEEFALANRNNYAAYIGWYFPRRFNFYFESNLFFAGNNAKKKAAFEIEYKYLIQKLTLANKDKRLILKNPANTSRVKILLELFPNAKFIYLYRDPYQVYYSTLRLHIKMLEQFTLQDFKGIDLHKIVPDIYVRMLKKYKKDKQQIHSGNLVEINYDNLINNPLDTLEHIYNALEIEGFEKHRHQFIRFIQTQKNYRAATYSGTYKEERQISDIMKVA